MIDQHPAVSGSARLRLVLHPPRALSGRQVGALFAVLSGAMWSVALLSTLQGNVFAPVFALLDSLLVAAALRWMWRLGERSEQIDVDEGAIRVSRCSGPAMAAAPVFEAHPCWVRLSVGESGREPHVMLDARGRRVEVGGFLAPDERRVLAGRLHTALQAASGRPAWPQVQDARHQERSE